MARKNRVTQSNFLGTGVMKLLRMGLVLARGCVEDKQLAFRLQKG